VLEEEEESWTSKGGAPYASKHSFFCTCAVERDGSGVGGAEGAGQRECKSLRGVGRQEEDSARMNECVCGCGVDHGTAATSIRVCFDLRHGNHDIPARAPCRARAVRLAAILLMPSLRGGYALYPPVVSAPSSQQAGGRFLGRTLSILRKALIVPLYAVATLFNPL